MKTVLIVSILLYAMVMPAMGALTDADLDKIRLIIQEEISKEIKPIQADIQVLKTDVHTLKTDVHTLKTDVHTLKTEGAIRQTEITSLKGNVATGFANIEKNFDRQNNIIIACIGIPLGIMAIGATVWGLLAHKQNTKDRALERQVETLTEEIEALKQQRIVNP